MAPGPPSSCSGRSWSATRIYSGGSSRRAIPWPTTPGGTRISPNCRGEEFDRTISRTQEILGEHATPCLRPPYAATGKHTREWAAEHGLEVYLWSVSANDWLGLNAQEIADRIVSQVTDGSIVLMHDGGGNRPQTVRGLEMVLERLSDRGVRYEPLCR